MSDADELFAWFCRAHYGAVARSAAIVTGSVEEGKDVAQEAFARAFQHWRKVSAMERPEAWVHRVATNLAVSHVRHEARRPHPDPEPQVREPEPADEELLRSVRELPPAQRAVVALRFYLDWSVEDVAEALRKRPGTVRALTHQAMTRLRAERAKESNDG